MKTKHAAALLQEDTTTLKAAFPHGGKWYTFRVHRDLVKQLQDFDHVLVELMSGEIKVVQVMRIDEEPDLDLDSNIEYCWAFQRVNMAELTALKDRDAKVQEKLNASRRRAAVHNLRESFGVSDEEHRKLLEFDHQREEAT